MRKETADGTTISPFAYPESFEEVLKELNERHKNRSVEDEELWGDLQTAKDEVEALLKEEYSSVTSHTAFVTDVDLGVSTNFLWDDDEERWKEPSVSHLSAFFSHLLSLF